VDEFLIGNNVPDLTTLQRLKSYSNICTVCWQTTCR